MRRKSGRETTQVGKASPPDPFDSDESDADEPRPAAKETAEELNRHNVWLSHDSGQQALSTLGANSPHVTQSSLIFLLTTLLPVKLFAPDH